MISNPTMTTKFIFITVFLLYLTLTQAYELNQTVPLYVNKVGPYFNPQETYHFYSLPVCRPEKIEHKALTLGEVLDGDRMAYSLYQINFKQNEKEKILCKKFLSKEDITQYKQAIEELYYFEFIVESFPLRGFIGHFEEGLVPIPHINHRSYLWTHLAFNFEYNEESGKIISANVSTHGHKPVLLENSEFLENSTTSDSEHTTSEGLEVTFTYSVDWTETSTTEADLELIKSAKSAFFPKSLEIHWLSIINSVILTVLLVGVVVVILMKILKNDFNRYNKDEFDIDGINELDTFGDDDGWKIIHSDVFRLPPYVTLFCAILGVGCQFLCLCAGIMAMALLGLFKPHKHGSINTAAVLLYALTSCVAGYVSSSFYRKLNNNKNNGDRWVRNIVLTSCLFTLPLFTVWLIINTVHWYAGSTQALPFTTIILLIFIWILVGFPLTIIGGIFGRNTSTEFNAPCRTAAIAREIPSQPWYRMFGVHIALGGFLPFSAISVELYYVFATVWGREQYTLYGILTVSFLILLTVSACVSVSMTYIQLANEDWRWWWRSIFSAGSISFFVFFYGIFYFYKKSNMSGMVQSVEFFGYLSLTCYGFFLTLGSFSFFASFKFIRYIYRNLKMD